MGKGEMGTGNMGRRDEQKRGMKEGGERNQMKG